MSYFVTDNVSITPKCVPLFQNLNNADDSLPAARGESALRLKCANTAVSFAAAQRPDKDCFVTQVAA